MVASQKYLVTSLSKILAKTRSGFEKWFRQTLKLGNFPLPLQLQIFRNYLWWNLTKIQAIENKKNFLKGIITKNQERIINVPLPCKIGPSIVVTLYSNLLIYFFENLTSLNINKLALLKTSTCMRWVSFRLLHQRIKAPWRHQKIDYLLYFSIKIYTFLYSSSRAVELWGQARLRLNCIKFRIWLECFLKFANVLTRKFVSWKTYMQQGRNSRRYIMSKAF